MKRKAGYFVGEEYFSDYLYACMVAKETGKKVVKETLQTFPAKKYDGIPGLWDQTGKQVKSGR